MTSESLAGLSNDLLYSAMAVYAAAMYCYAAELAFGSPGRRRRAVPVAAGARELASIGAPTAYGEDTVAAVDADDDGPTRLARADRVGRVAVSLTVLAFLLHAAAGRWPAGSPRSGRRGATCTSSRRPARWPSPASSSCC